MRFSGLLKFEAVSERVYKVYVINFYKGSILIYELGRVFQRAFKYFMGFIARETVFLCEPVTGFLELLILRCEYEQYLLHL